MNNTSEVSGLMQVTKERKGLLITASIFSTLSRLLQIVPFVGVYKIVEELLTHTSQLSAMDKDLLIYWGDRRIRSPDCRACCALYRGDVLTHCCVQHFVPAQSETCGACCQSTHGVSHPGGNR
ncbi:hypothetical protein ACMX2M_07025 [Paenibacillus polymyxa]|uniref:hypothetical protein n=1 Tax=Paenibacillus amylolyticus TaxID=1451 RepID=UPI00201DFD0E|nr:hypothetical protein [Paenibacillus amylolyticus]MCL6661986.1 hypothetical protein [Paenibacillus amylolyticus]